MIKISDAIYEIIKENASLSFAFHHRILNLSQTARFIKPAVETRTRKEVTESAILMNLSRLQAKVGHQEPGEAPHIHMDKVTIHSGLCTLTLSKSVECHRQVNQLFALIREDGGFITITEGITEITLIIDNAHYQLATETITEKPKYVKRNLSSVGVKFSDKMLREPGLIYQLLQQIVLQNINLVEVVSTATEFNIYLDETDVEQAFEAIYRRFVLSDRR